MGEFGAFLAGKLAEGAANPVTPDGLAVEDLYVAFACGNGDSKALRAFDREMHKDLEAAFAKMRILPAQRDDVRQQLRERLFVGPPRPRIFDYSGRGRLRFWFRVTV